MVDPLDLLKNQDTDAMKWAQAFMDTAEKQGWTLPPEVDVMLMLAWFANAMMTQHDYTYWKKIKPLEVELEKEKAESLRLFTMKIDEAIDHPCYQLSKELEAENKLLKESQCKCL